MTNSLAFEAPSTVHHPVRVTVKPALHSRNRLTCAFRPILAIPHILLVGGPIAFGITSAGRMNGEPRFEWGTGGVLGGVALVTAIIAWFAIVFGARFPAGLWSLSAMYLRWRVRAVAYLMLLRDEYPPFVDASYPAALHVTEPPTPRDRVTVAFRLVLGLPHIVVLWFLGVAWALTTVIAWFVILFTGSYPAPLFRFGVGVLRWTTRVEAYLLLLRDEYPPFLLSEDRP